METKRFDEGYQLTGREVVSCRELRQTGQRDPFRRVEHVLELGHHKPPECCQEGDRRGLSEGQPIELVSGEPTDPGDHGRDLLGSRRGRPMDVRWWRVVTLTTAG